MKNHRIVLLNVQDIISQNMKRNYIEHFVEIPESVNKLGLSFKYTNPFTEDNPQKVICFISFYDVVGFRGHRMHPSGRGDVVLELWVTPNTASEGAIPGVIQPGLWRILIDIRVMDLDLNYELNVYYEEGQLTQNNDLSLPPSRVINDQPGWYKGELHAHSTESDGKYSVDQVVDAAVEYGMDFLSLTDHTTCSQWHKLSKHNNKEIALVRSLEITSHIGHANLHGIHEWVNGYIDQPDWSVNQAVDDVHRQGGLFCVNHPFSGFLSWRDFSLNWEGVDLLEIYHNLEGTNNVYQIALWEKLLSHGYRIVGVGGIDSHNPFEGLDEYGQVVTWVYCDELSECGVIEGLRRGQVYVSRGPEFQFTASNKLGNNARMWEILPCNDEISLEMKVKWHEPLNLFVIKDGLIFDIIKTEALDDEWFIASIVDPDPKPGSYYRVECHDDIKRMPYKGIMVRDHLSMRILSNPIWIGK